MSSRNYFIISLFIATLLLSMVSVYSCKKIVNPNSDLNTKDTLTYDFLKTRVFLQVYDANTLQNIVNSDGKKLNVVIGGKSKDALVDIIGARKDVYFPANGFLSFGILPEFIPSEASPIVFTVNIEYNGYLSSSKQVTITNEGDYYLKIPIINVEDPPEGITITHEWGVGNLYNGVLFDSVNIFSPDMKTIVNIPSGIKLTTFDSVDLAGKLNLTLVQYDINFPASIEALKGGISSSLLKNNSVKNGVFSPVGIVKLVITDSDWKEAYFVEDKPIEVIVSVPNNVLNPLTNQEYKVGDKIDRFTYYNDTSLWVYQNTDTVNGSVGNKFIVGNFFNLTDYIFANYNEIACNKTASFESAGECTDCGSFLIDGTLIKQDDNSYISHVSLIANSDGPSNLPITTGNTKIAIQWHDNSQCSNCIVDPTSNPTLINDMCNQGAIDLPLINEGPATTTITANFSGACSSDTNYLILPSFGIWVRQIDSPCWKWSSMIDGKANICNLVFGEKYIIGTYYNGIWKEWETTIGIESDYNFVIEFSSSVCKDVFGIL